MNFLRLSLAWSAVCFVGCRTTTAVQQETYPNLVAVGAMKNVMWKGELHSRIALDTIANKTGLYGLGPVSYLKGELLINDGKAYVSSVTGDTTMRVAQTFKSTEPFFVYGHVTQWKEIEIPADVKTLEDLEQFTDTQTASNKRPFAFKLTGKVANASIHVQNLPDGTKVTSPEIAHRGQVNYTITNKEVTIIGFFSTTHQGIFTHHDSFVHMHLITKDENTMGHVDALEIGKMKLYLPVQ